MKLFFLLTASLLPAACILISASHRQHIPDPGNGPFNVVQAIATGDLNKDKLPDSVIVLQDTLSKYRPYMLKIYFTQSGGTKKLEVITENAINPQFPNGNDWRTGGGFDTIEVKNGVLTIKNGLLRGAFEHKFRYQNGNFELIGFTYVASDGQGFIDHYDYNLSTGNYRRKHECYSGECEEKDYDTLTKHKLEQLPKLQEFEPLGYDNKPWF